MARTKILAFVMAGGKGTRLEPLTLDQAKPAVIFGGKYRIIDFVLSNMVNSGLLKVKVLTQFKSDTLNKHIANGWQLNHYLGQYIDTVPAQMRTGEAWYQGTADAIHQNLDLIYESEPELVLVFGGDHVYKMDVMQMVEFHRQRKCVATVAAIPVPVSEASAFGIIKADNESRIVDWVEKPPQPPEIPDRPGWSYASMGNYVFQAAALIEALKKDAANPNSNHDFGKDVIPYLQQNATVYAYDFSKNVVPGANQEQVGYWRDVGTLDAYYEANMDLRSVHPKLNLYNYKWPLRTAMLPYPPAKFVFNEKGRKGEAIDSIVSGGCIISGGRVIDSILSPNVFVHSYAEVRESIIFNGVHIGRNAKIKRAIIEKHVNIPADTEIGYNLEEDRKKYIVTAGGLVVVPQESPETIYLRRRAATEDSNQQQKL